MCYDLAKIKNRSCKWSHILDKVGVGRIRNYFASLYSTGSAISDVEAQEHYDRFFEVCTVSKSESICCKFFLWIAICFSHVASKNLLAHQEINALFVIVNCE